MIAIEWGIRIRNGANGILEMSHNPASGRGMDKGKVQKVDEE